MVSLPGFENVKRDINTICLARSSGTCLAAVLHKGKRNGQIRQEGTTKGQGGDHARKRGTLQSGRSGKKATSRKQAIAIGLSKARKTGAKVPPKKGGSKKK